MRASVNSGSGHHGDASTAGPAIHTFLARAGRPTHRTRRYCRPASQSHGHLPATTDDTKAQVGGRVCTRSPSGRNDSPSASFPSPIRPRSQQCVAADIKERPRSGATGFVISAFERSGRGLSTPAMRSVAAAASGSRQASPGTFPTPKTTRPTRPSHGTGGAIGSTPSR
jgi:hypothetical protein